MSDSFDELLNEALNLQQNSKNKKSKQQTVVSLTDLQKARNGTPRLQTTTYQPAWIPKALCLLVHRATCQGCGTIHSTPDRFTYISFTSTTAGKHVEVFDPEHHAGLRNLPLTQELHTYFVPRCQDCAAFGEIHLRDNEGLPAVNPILQDFDKKREA